MKIMISQPMNGKTTKQIRKERQEIVDALENNGFEVLDTVFEENASNVYLLGKSIEYLAEADAVIFMPGWENARGCRIEFEVAKEYGKWIKIL